MTRTTERVTAKKCNGYGWIGYDNCDCDPDGYYKCNGLGSCGMYECPGCENCEPELKNPCDNCGRGERTDCGSLIYDAMNGDYDCMDSRDDDCDHCELTWCKECKASQTTQKGEDDA